MVLVVEQLAAAEVESADVWSRGPLAPELLGLGPFDRGAQDAANCGAALLEALDPLGGDEDRGDEEASGEDETDGGDWVFMLYYIIREGYFVRPLRTWPIKPEPRVLIQ